MAIISSAVSVTVEPEVSTLDIALSTSIMGSDTTTIVTVTALDSGGNPVPNAAVEVYAVPADEQLTSISESSNEQTPTKIGSGTTNSSGQFSVTYDIGPLYDWTGSANLTDNYVAAAFQATATYANVSSSIVYAYPYCTITIAASNTEPEVGQDITLSATVQTVQDIFAFGLNPDNGSGEAFVNYVGYVYVTFVATVGTTPNVYTAIETNSDGAASLSVSFSAVETVSIVAVATGQSTTQVS